MTMRGYIYKAVSDHPCHSLFSSLCPFLLTRSFKTSGFHSLPVLPLRSKPLRSIRSLSLKSRSFKFATTTMPAHSRSLHQVTAISVGSEDHGGAAAISGAVAFDDPCAPYDDHEGLGTGYRLPPPEIRDIVDAPPVPVLSFSPQRDKILFLKRRSLPPLSDLARPEEKLAGIRIDGKCNTRSRMSFYTGIGIHRLMDDGTIGPEKEINGLPEGAKINFVTWSNNGHYLAFSVRVEEEAINSSKLNVWIADVETGTASPLFQSPNVYLNAIFDKYSTSRPLQALSNSKHYSLCANLFVHIPVFVRPKLTV